MASDLGTRLGRAYGQQTETQAKAARYLEDSGNADLLPILGLADPPERDERECPACGHPLRGDGRTACRQTACPAGPKARKAAAGGEHHG